MTTIRKTFGLAVLGTALFAAGCGGADAPANTAAAAEPGSAAVAPVEAPAPTGNVVEVRMISGRGEIFEPSTVTVKRGDVVRFVLDSGVHNVSFPANKNPGGIALPATSAYLTSPGQAHEMTVDLPAGSYTFQCDPHTMMGMTGTLTVSD
jgi:plastocyanin